MDITNKYFRGISRPGVKTKPLADLPEEKRKLMAENRERYLGVSKIIEKRVRRSLDNDPVGVFDLAHYGSMARELIGPLWQVAKTEEGRAKISRGQLPAEISALMPKLQAKWVGRGKDAKLAEKVLNVTWESFVDLLRKSPEMFRT